VCCCRKLVWRGWRRISVLTFVLWVVAAGTHFVHISVNYLAGNLCASVGNCWSICGKVICIPRGIEDSAEPGLSSRSLHWWFCESSIERNYLHPLCAELRIASCTESDNDGDVVLDCLQREPVNNLVGSIYRMRAPQRRSLLSTRTRYRLRRPPEITQ
jgi:hypothetical protein